MKDASRAAARLLFVLLGSVTTVAGIAQAAPAKAAAAENPSLGFSIESEMLTYRALETNSEAVACDITGYLNGSSPDFINPPPGAVCGVKAGSHNVSVVLLPFDKSTFTDFQIWRADMVTMDELRRKAASFDCPAGSKAGVAATANSALNLTPAGPMISAAQGVLGLLASEETTSPVMGTVEDQAFLNGVGRQLRNLKVPVIMPTGYFPNSLVPLDLTSSPFLASLSKLQSVEGCLTEVARRNDENHDSVVSTIAGIDKFRNLLEAATTAPAAKTSGEDKASSTTPAATPAAAPDHLYAVLLADGLAQALGVDPRTGKIQENGPSQHFLLLKALESGGSVSRKSNILGTKISYSGGFVGTYALFSMAGDLECSGNVFDFGGSVKGKQFEKELKKSKELNKYPIEPGKQIIFQRGDCLSSVPQH